MVSVNPAKAGIACRNSRFRGIKIAARNQSFLKSITAALALLLITIFSHQVVAAPLHDLRLNNLESVGAGPSGPGGDIFYSARAYAYGAHDYIYDLATAEQGSGRRVLSAYFKDTGSRWVYLGTLNRNGEISRTYFDLVAGAIGTLAALHDAAISPQGGGWYRVSITFDLAGVSSLYFGIAETNGSPFFASDPRVNRVYFSSPRLDAGTATPTAANAAATRAMWIWKADTVLNVQQRTELMTFAANREINTFYIDARTPVLHNQYMLAEFIRASQARGISVELLFGKPEWALYYNHHEVLTLIDAAVDYGRRYPDARPTAVHLDIEAHLIPQWQGDRNGVVNQLLDLYDEVDDRAAEVGMPLLVDMPVWYDQYLLPRHGQSRPMHEWIIDSSDGVALMDYRDTEERIVNDADAELRYASATGKNMIVGVETMCINPEQITFCEEGSGVMNGVLGRVNTRLRSHGAYRGVAIHHYEDYRRLRP